MAQAAEVFVSYSRDDAGRVLEVAGKLRAAGVSLWIDQGGIDAASLWSEQIVNALEGAKVLLLMVTGSAVHSHNVAKEVVLVSERKGHILPVFLEPTVIPPALKYQLAGIQHVEYFDGGDAEASFKAILRSLERIGVSFAAPPEAKTPSPAAETGAATAVRPPVSGEAGALAVMPFDNISPDQETDYFSDGLTEELIARLSLVSEIELISRWATKQLKEKKHDVRAIGTELGARYIVGGSVRRFQDSVRITVQLVDVGTNRQIWGNTYKGKLDDIFDIQEQVAQQIVEALKLKLSFSEKVSLTKRQTVNAQAYDLYLRGQDYLYRLTKRSVEYAIQLFEKAIELDPRYAAAYAACSSAYGQMYQYFARDEKYRNRAQELSFKALCTTATFRKPIRRWGCPTSSGASLRKPAPPVAKPSNWIPTISSRTGRWDAFTSRTASSRKPTICSSASPPSSPRSFPVMRTWRRPAMNSGAGTRRKRRAPTCWRCCPTTSCRVRMTRVPGCSTRSCSPRWAEKPTRCARAQRRSRSVPMIP